MNPNLSFESEVGVGTHVLLTACFERVSEKLDTPQATTPTAVASSIERPLTVLIVEDHLPI